MEGWENRWLASPALARARPLDLDAHRCDQEAGLASPSSLF